MAQANEGAAGANSNGAVPHADGAAVADGAVPLVNGELLARVRGALVLQAAAPVAGPLVPPVAGALQFPQVGPVHGHIDVDGVLLGPLPTKSNGSCKILPKIVDEN